MRVAVSSGSMVRHSFLSRARSCPVVSSRARPATSATTRRAVCTGRWAVPSTSALARRTSMTPSRSNSPTRGRRLVTASAKVTRAGPPYGSTATQPRPRMGELPDEVVVVAARAPPRRYRRRAGPGACDTNWSRATTAARHRDPTVPNDRPTRPLPPGTHRVPSPPRHQAQAKAGRSAGMSLTITITPSCNHGCDRFRWFRALVWSRTGVRLRCGGGSSAPRC